MFLHLFHRCFHCINAYFKDLWPLTTTTLHDWAHHPLYSACEENWKWLTANKFLNLHSCTWRQKIPLIKDHAHKGEIHVKIKRGTISCKIKVCTCINFVVHHELRRKERKMEKSAVQPISVVIIAVYLYTYQGLSLQKHSNLCVCV